MGAPKNNTNATRAKEWRDALTYALENFSGCEKGMALRDIGAKLIEMALGGDIQAIREIGDRIDGKAVQFVDQTFRDVTDAAELSDEELAGIAATSSTGAAKAKRGKEKSDSVH